ncbi:MAG: hypothetical protein VB118_09970 [Oscillospiraceae bacterium]|nr:hypothetical protein [Oscillospiraceae bacterium]
MYKQVHKLTVVVAAVFIVLFLAQGAYAADNPDTVTEQSDIGVSNELGDMISEAAGADKLNEFIPDSIKDSAPDADVLSGDKAYETLFSMFLGVFANSLRGELKFFAGLCGFIMLSALICALRRTYTSDMELFEIVSVLCLSAYAYSIVGTAFDAASHYIKELNIFIKCMLPVMTSLYTLGGNAASAAVQNTGIFLACELLDTLCAEVLLPLLRIGFAFSLASAISPAPLAGISKFLKNLMSGLCVAMMTLFGTVLYFQTSLASAADTALLRTARFAAGTFIPVVGSLVGEAAKTVGGGISVIKSTTGFFGIAVIIYILAVPIIGIFTKKLSIGFASLCAGLVGAAREEAFLKELGELFNILLAFLFSTGIYFIIALTIFIKTGVSV